VIDNSQVDDVDESDVDPRQVLLQQGGSRKSLGSDDITDTTHDDVGLCNVPKSATNQTILELLHDSPPR
jgi:hypothetical protein